MRKNIIAANWKMNLNNDEVHQLVNDLLKNGAFDTNSEIVLFVPSIYLQDLKKTLGSRAIIGAQNFFPKESGAFTGEISLSQLGSIGIANVLIGHSERRAIFKEGVDFLREKVDHAVSKNFNFTFCCGEPAEIRGSGEQNAFVEWQFASSLFHLNKEEFKNCTIAYEPVWAIGTGKTATVEQIEDMHKYIRTLVEKKYDHETAQNLSILYGGSCNPANAKDIFACPNVDGGLIGGASLVAEDFVHIINSI